MSVNERIAAIMLTAFFKNFQDKIWFPDYNWNYIPSEVLGELTVHQNTVEVAAWDELEVEQVQGTCGGTNIFTEMLRNDLNAGNSLFCGFISIVLPIIVVIYLEIFQLQ